MDTKKTPMTQQEVENWILLKGQSGERWFEFGFIDEDMNKDPTAAALMKSIADVIQGGLVAMALEEMIPEKEIETMQ